MDKYKKIAEEARSKSESTEGQLAAVRKVNTEIDVFRISLEIPCGFWLLICDYSFHITFSQGTASVLDDLRCMFFNCYIL